MVSKKISSSCYPLTVKMGKEMKEWNFNFKRYSWKRARN